MIFKTILLVILLIINVLLLFCMVTYAWLKWYIWKHKEDVKTKEEWKLME